MFVEALCVWCLDRFSIITESTGLEDVDGLVPFWVILETLLKNPVSIPTQLIELLDTIAVLLRQSSGPAGDFVLLRDFLSSHHEVFFGECWPSIVEAALEMPLLFPQGRLPLLQREVSTQHLSLTKKQVSCLVAHQFLCTLPQPQWRDECYDFSIWYSNHQRHPQACRIYLTSLMEYFKTLRDDIVLSLSLSENWEVSYHLHAGASLELPRLDCRLCPVEVALVNNYDTTPDSLGLPDGAAVVSANKFIGFGQSATQEEIHVGVTPEACPAVLFTPPLEDDQILVVKGASAILNVVGQRRDLRIGDILPRQLDASIWQERVMLFMDALELDLASDEDGLPDLRPECIDRELRKAYLSFYSGRYHNVISPFWGCGAFGGDPGVKMLLLWCAASLAQTSLKIVCDEQLHGTGRDLKKAIGILREQCGTVEGVLRMVRSMPKHLKRLETLSWIISEWTS
ncbi:hypothetical protein JX265_001183 [Neoarthrinium moseri]|uniref:poly(ADP-ribose) glycohydrolase n=1 Tax=Neoarthrinium moseri TaxID=1658444 RepID=A0A9P9WXK0_9PEZI|nr:hypothetical protein JX265_001183 [Neoarthrinium moseri]